MKDDISATTAIPVSASEQNIQNEQSEPTEILGKDGSKLKITAEDKCSGVKEIRCFQCNSRVTDTDSISNWNTVESDNAVLEIRNNDYIYVCAMDNAGKESEIYEYSISMSDDSAPESNPNGNPSSTIPDYIIPNESAATVTAAATTPATAQTTAETAVQPTNTEPNLLFEDITEQPETTYSESDNISNSDSEQTTTKETAVGNENNSDNPPKTGNVSGFAPIMAVTAVSLVGIGTATLYNKKRKR